MNENILNSCFKKNFSAKSDTEIVILLRGFGSEVWAAGALQTFSGESSTGLTNVHIMNDSFDFLNFSKHLFQRLFTFLICLVSLFLYISLLQLINDNNYFADSAWSDL